MYVLGKGVRERKFHPCNSNGVEGGIWKRLCVNDMSSERRIRKERSLPKVRAGEQIWFPRTPAKDDFQSTGVGSTLLRE